MMMRWAGVVCAALLTAACTSDGSAGFGAAPRPQSDPPHSSEVERVHVHDEPWCAPAPVADVVDSGLSSEESAAARAWRTDGGLGANFGAIHEYAEERRDLVLGAYVDDDAQAHVVVVDPAQPERLAEIAGELEERTETLPIRVEPGCHHLAELERARTGIHDGDPAVMPDVPLTVELDPALGRVVVRLSDEPATQDYAGVLRDAYGDLVHIEFETFMISDDPGV